MYKISNTSGGACPTGATTQDQDGKPPPSQDLPAHAVESVRGGLSQHLRMSSSASADPRHSSPIPIKAYKSGGLPRERVLVFRKAKRNDADSNAAPREPKVVIRFILPETPPSSEEAQSLFPREKF